MTETMPNSAPRAGAGAGAKRAKGKPIPVKFEGVEAAPLVFANVFLVQHDAQTFYLTFALATPLLTIGMSAEEINAIEHVSARAAVRVALTPGRMYELIDILNRNYEKFRKTDERAKSSRNDNG